MTRTGPSGAPQIFRCLLPAKDLERSQRFYENLFKTRGRWAGGGRVYFDCGSVILGMGDYSRTGPGDRTIMTEAIYFSAGNLEELHRRARKLGCLAPGLIHNDPANPAGEIVLRPWGERSFDANDPSGNPLCFVDATTLYTGNLDQVAGLAEADRRRPSSRPVGQKSGSNSRNGAPPAG